MVNYLTPISSQYFHFNWSLENFVCNGNPFIFSFKKEKIAEKNGKMIGKKAQNFRFK